MGTHSSHTLGTVALWLSILGVVLSFILIGLPLLVVSLIIGIIALSQQRSKAAIASVIISGVPLFLVGLASYFLWQVFYHPFQEFQQKIETLKQENVAVKEAFEDPRF